MLIRIPPGFAVLSLAAAFLNAAEQVERTNFEVSGPVGLIIQNDYGSVTVRASNEAAVVVEAHKTAPDEKVLHKIVLVTAQSRDKIFLHTYYYEYEGGYLDLNLRVPHDTSLMIGGANPEVRIEGLKSHLRVQTLTGAISIENTNASVSALSDSGDIHFSTAIQPQHDVRLESVTGNLLCSLPQKSGVEAWLRAGGTIYQNGRPQKKPQLRQSYGSGGPLLYASSLQGDVSLDMIPMVDDASATHSTGRASVEEKPSTVLKEGGRSQKESVPEPGSSGSVTSQPGTTSSPALSPAPVETARGAVDTGYSLKVDVDWIYLNASVRERRTNRAISSLTKDDFLVLEEGVQQAIEKFEPVESPIHLLLLLDVSGSTQKYLSLMKKAAISFTRQIKENDQIALAVFNSRTRLLQDFTGSRERISEAIDKIRSGGGTAFYDALHESVTDYMRKIHGRKAVVVFTDGVDNQFTGDYQNGSQIGFQELYRDIQETESMIYPILLDTEEDVVFRRGGSRGGLADILGDILLGRLPPYNPGGRGPRDRDESLAYEEARRQLEMIAEQTGGRLYSPQRIEDLSGAYSEIAQDLRIQYTLAYNSTHRERDGKWRSIDVRIKNRPDAVVRTRRGYYATSSSRVHASFN
ncbi:MAG: VWA domain-containing protein [Acidobacteria bacterium]|nr:VWA domain-containing protein [Acidobacteriota bacterium]